MDTKTYRNERVLVTGGAGFIGSSLCDRLLSKGASVQCLDNFDPFYDPALKRRYIHQASTNPNYVLNEGDFGDPATLDRAFEWRPSVIVHLAALAGVRPSIVEPARYMRINVEGSTRLLQRCVDEGVERVIFASSSSVYGNRKSVPFLETDPVDDPVSPYAASKKAGELICYTYHNLYGLRTTCLRFFTVYGPRQRPEMAIHKFVRKVLAKQPLSLFGDGSSSRDYTYIDDIIDGVLASIERSHPFEIINLGDSSPISLSGLVDTIEQVTGVEAIRKHLPMQAGDVERTFASVDRARELLGYEPHVSLVDGISRFVDWYHSFQPGS